MTYLSSTLYSRQVLDQNQYSSDEKNKQKSNNHVPAAPLLPMAEIQAPPEVMRGCDADHEYGFS